MAKYTFQCRSCGKKEQVYAPSNSFEITCTCGETMGRQLPILNGSPNVTEIVDKYTGVTQLPDQKEQVQQRRDEYYWTVEVPRMVQSGTYSVETMLENGWIYLDDAGKVHINNRPPHLR